MRIKKISETIVFVDEIVQNLIEQVLNKKTPIYGDSITLSANQLSFKDVSNPIILSNIIGEDVIDITQPINNTAQKVYFGKFVQFTFDVFPPKIAIGSKNENVDVVDISKKLIHVAKIEKQIKRIGINFEVFVKLSSNTKLKDIILSEKISKEFAALSTTLVSDIDNSTKLNFTIADAEIEGEEGLFCQANFDTETNENTLLSILNKRDIFYKTLENKICVVTGEAI